MAKKRGKQAGKAQAAQKRQKSLDKKAGVPKGKKK